ncbi:hypothetical protein BJX66DRAFT_108588 [Aspergillus keveii]|uniref:Uncharacterized protein n=1 Tax=Aspergillus keveii TaxID=714993 RepID=A0ABR4GE30_9EURO
MFRFIYNLDLGEYLSPFGTTLPRFHYGKRKIPASSKCFAAFTCRAIFLAFALKIVIAPFRKPANIGVSHCQCL